MVLFFVAAVFAVPSAPGVQASVPGDTRHTVRGVYVYKKDSAPRSEFESSFSRREEGGRVFYDMTEQGKGNYDKYENISWNIQARMEEKEGLLYLIESRRVIKDEGGKTIIEYSKVFDYEKRTVHYRALDGKGKKISEKIFRLKEQMTDDSTMIYFLTAFIARRDDKSYRRFYLVTNEPELYKIDIKIIGVEEIKLDDGKVISAVKIRIIPNLGLLTGLSKLIVPPTYLWYRQEPPYQWIKYEGLETGLGSTHIVSYVTQGQLK
jgi:hypothetical protein